MRTSIASATFLLLGASAAAVGATYDPNNVSITGSDTLFQVTNDIMNVCDGNMHGSFAAAGNMMGHDKPYVGGGSGVGANAMALGGQGLAPMSRALKNIEYCNNSSAYTLSSQSTTNALIVGLDGVSIMANAAQSCSGDLPNSGANSSFTYTASDGSGSKTYTISNSLDALRIAFAGTDGSKASYEGDYGCNGPIRKALLANWSSLFTTACSAGKCDGSTDPTSQMTQPTGVSHLWRRSDLSGTTDAFVSLVNLGVRKVGNNPAQNPASFSYTINAFCNSVDANAVAPQATASGTACSADAQCPVLWGSKCVGGVCSGTKTTDTANIQNGHIAIPCLLTTTTNNRVVQASGAPANLALANPNNINQDCQVAGDTFQDADGNTLMQDSVCQQGPVLAGDASTAGSTNNTVRTGICHPGSLATFSDYADNDPVRVFCDSDGTNDTEQVCEKDGTLGVVLPILLPDVPTGTTALSTDEQYPSTACDSHNICKLSQTYTGDKGPCPRGGPRLLGRCFQPTGTDASNNVTFNCLATSATHCFNDSGIDGRAYNLQVKRKNGAEGGMYVQDSSFTHMVGSYFRIHQKASASYATATTGINTCKQGSDTNQIGCLVTSDPCSAGFAGREADKINGAFNRPLSVNTILPRLATSTPDSTITQLVDGVEPITHKKCGADADCAGLTQSHCNTQFGLCYPPADVVYPLARRLYVASLNGLGTLTGAEGELAKCYGDNNLLTPIIQNDNFVPVPGGASCIDYPEANNGVAEAIILNACGGASNGGSNANACSGVTAPLISH
jgi:hypothetical protein